MRNVWVTLDFCAGNFVFCRCWHWLVWTWFYQKTTNRCGWRTCHQRVTCSISLICCCMTINSSRRCCCHNQNHCELSTFSSRRSWVAMYLLTWTENSTHERTVAIINWKTYHGRRILDGSCAQVYVSDLLCILNGWYWWLTMLFVFSGHLYGTIPLG